MTFRRIVISGVGRLSVEETEHERRRDGTTLVRNRFTMISPGTEMSIYLGTNQNVMMRGAAGYPARIGYAAVGDVAEEPPADSGVARGDLLFHPSKHGDAACVDLADGLSAVVNDLEEPKDALFVRFAQIAATALRIADIQAGERVIVFGLGLIGQMAAQLFRIGGADVLAVDPLGYRRAAAEKAGIHTEERIARELSLSADVVVDATGVPAVINQGLEACRECGRLILLGSPRGTVEVDFYKYVHVRGIVILGAHERMQRFEERNRGWTRVENTRFVLRLIASGRLQTRHLVTHVIRPEEVKGIFAELAEQRIEALGIAIDWRGGAS